MRVSVVFHGPGAPGPAHSWIVRKLADGRGCQSLESCDNLRGKHWQDLVGFVIVGAVVLH